MLATTNTTPRSSAALVPRSPRDASPGARGSSTPRSAALMSSSRTRYAVCPTAVENGASTLSRVELRSIATFVEHNKKLQHSHRKAGIATVIPQGPFAKVVEGGDGELGLRIAPLHPKDSPLDIPLRLCTPADVHAPPLQDPRPSVPIAARLASLLKGATSVPVHSEGDTKGTERDLTLVRALQDAKLRVEASRRSGSADKGAAAYCVLASLHYNARSMELAAEAFISAVSLYESVGNVPALAFCHNVLGVIFYITEEYKMALVHFKKQEVLCGHYGKAVAQINLGVCYTALGNLDFAQQAFQGATENAIEAGEEPLIVIAKGNLGMAFMRDGNMKEAQAHFEDALERCSVAGDSMGASIILLLLGEIFCACGDFNNALFYFENAHSIAVANRTHQLASIASVSVGICKGNIKERQLLIASSNAMGKQLNIKDVISSIQQR